jgi:putative transposase
MPRIARSIIVDLPYHITQRGNRGQEVFFSDRDRKRYMSWLKDYAERYELEILAYCLMTTHVHLVSIPRKSFSMSKTLQFLHTRHSNVINSEHGWNGHLWQGRFFSAALDDAHLWLAMRYVERNPVRAGMVEQAADYPWSSAAFHLGIGTDKLIRSDTQWGGMVESWAEALGEDEEESALDMLRDRTKRGYPCGSDDFIASVAALTGQSLDYRQRGRPKKK